MHTLKCFLHVRPAVFNNERSSCCVCWKQTSLCVLTRCVTDSVTCSSGCVVEQALVAAEEAPCLDFTPAQPVTWAKERRPTRLTLTDGDARMRDITLRPPCPWCRFPDQKAELSLIHKLPSVCFYFTTMCGWHGCKDNKLLRCHGRWVGLPAYGSAHEELWIHMV